MNQNANVSRGITTVEYLLVVAFLTTIIVGTAAIFRSTGIGHAERINSPLGNSRGNTGPDTSATDWGTIETTDNPGWRTLGVVGWQLLFATGFTICMFLLVRIRWARKSEDSRFRQRVKRDELELTRHIMLEKRTALQSILSRNRDSVFKSELTVGDIMSRSVICVAIDESIEKLKQKMGENQIHHILVVDNLQNLVGIISDRDLGNAAETDRSARDVMTPDPIAIMPHTDIKQAISMILRHRFSALPVVNGGRKVSGILTSSDLLATLQCTLGLLFEISCLLQTESGSLVVERELGAEMLAGFSRPASDQTNV